MAATQPSSRNPAVPPPGDLVELRQSRQVVTISPPVERLDHYFFTVLHHRGHHPEHGAAILPVADPLVWKVTKFSRPALRCLAGLKGLIKEFLEGHGLRVKLAGEPAALAHPDRDQLSCFPRIDWELLWLVRYWDRGLIWFERGGKVSVARLVAQIALGWPEKRLVIVVTRIQDARRLARDLRRYLPRVGLSTS